MVFFLPKFESVNEELLQSVHMGQISPREAGDLQAGMESKRLRSLVVLSVCAVVFSFWIVCAMNEHDFHYAIEAPLLIEVLLLLIWFFAPIITAIYQIGGFFTARTYLRALRHSRPGSVTNEHPLYNLNVIDQQLLEKIAARKFTDAEAGGLLNIANAARAGNKQALMLAAVFISIGIFAGFDPFEIDVGGEFMSIFSLTILGAAVSGFFTRFLRLSKNAQYISAIKAKYPSLSLKEYGRRRE